MNELQDFFWHFVENWSEIVNDSILKTFLFFITFCDVSLHRCFADRWKSRLKLILQLFLCGRSAKNENEKAFTFAFFDFLDKCRSEI